MTANRHSSQATRIPVISIEPLFFDDAAAKAGVAHELRTACEEIGFFYIRDHGVSDQKIVNIIGAMKEFFRLPMDERMRIAVTPEHHRGYIPIGGRSYGTNGRTELRDTYKMLTELPDNDPDLLSGKPLHQRNKWPNGLPGFRDCLLNYYDDMNLVSDALLRGFALALELDERHFLPSFRKPITQLSFNHYPPQPSTAPEDQYGIKPHSDTTAFTILWADPIGGLEIKPVGQDWIDAPYIDGTFLINIGDMMARWTNDRFMSTPHRVINHTGQERYSIPFFVNPDFDAVVACLETCTDAQHPPKYPPQHVGDYMVNYTRNAASKPKIAAAAVA